MISLLVTLLVVALVASIAIYIIRLFPIPAPFGNILVAVVLIIILIWILTSLGGFGHLGSLRG